MAVVLTARRAARRAITALMAGVLTARRAARRMVIVITAITAVVLTARRAARRAGFTMRAGSAAKRPARRAITPLMADATVALLLRLWLRNPSLSKLRSRPRPLEVKVLLIN